MEWRILKENLAWTILSAHKQVPFARVDVGSGNGSKRRGQLAEIPTTEQVKKTGSLERVDGAPLRNAVDPRRRHQP
jgi:hypothetical protein